MAPRMQLEMESYSVYAITCWSCGMGLYIEQTGVGENMDIEQAGVGDGLHMAGRVARLSNKCGFKLRAAHNNRWVGGVLSLN